MEAGMRTAIDARVLSKQASRCYVVGLWCKAAAQSDTCKWDPVLKSCITFLVHGVMVQHTGNLRAK